MNYQLALVILLIIIFIVMIIGIDEHLKVKPKLSANASMGAKAKATPRVMPKLLPLKSKTGADKTLELLREPVRWTVEKVKELSYTFKVLDDSNMIVILRYQGVVYEGGKSALGITYTADASGLLLTNPSMAENNPYRTVEVKYDSNTKLLMKVNDKWESLIKGGPMHPDDRK